MACADIFRGSKDEYIGNFSSFFGYKSICMLRLWESFWLLSLLGVKASDVFGLSMTLLCFVKHLVHLISFLDLWEGNRENGKCINICKEIEFKVSHIIHEGNHCVYKLALLNLKNKLDFKWYDDLSVIIKLDFFFHNRYQLSLFRFVYLGWKYLSSFLVMGLA